MAGLRTGTLTHFRSKKDETNNAIKKLLGKREIDKNAIVNRKLLKAAKILERMVNQNTYNDIAQGEIFSV